MSENEYIFLNPKGSKIVVRYDPYEEAIIIEDYALAYTYNDFVKCGEVRILFKKEAEFLIESIRRLMDKLS